MTTDNARSRMSGERNMTLADYPRQRRAAARYHDAKLRLTHVVVGDHQPEPRVEHDDDGTRVPVGDW